MEILVNNPLHPHYCQGEIAKDPREKELGVGSQVRCDCGRTYILIDHQWDGRSWVAHTYVR